MKTYITKFSEEKAGVYQNGNLKAFDLVPAEKESKLIFHYVKLKEGSVTEMETNDVDKTFLIQKGAGKIVVDGESYMVSEGDAVWLPQESSHIIENGTGQMEFIVVKER